MIDYTFMFERIRIFVTNNTTALKWGVNLCFVLATVIMISPAVAAHSIYPWVLFLIGNVILIVDSFVHKLYPWFWTSVVFIVYDVLLIYSRLMGVDTLHLIRPLITQLDKFLI